MLNLPNVLTILRFFLTPVLWGFLLNFFPGLSVFFSMTAAIVLYLLISITDFLDGYLARKMDLKTKLGEFLDPLADKFFTISVFFCFLYIESIAVPLWSVSAIVIREVLVTVLRLYALAGKKIMKTAFHGKLKTVIQIVAQSAVLIVLWIFAYWNHFDVVSDGKVSQVLEMLPAFVTAIAAFVSVTSGVFYVLENRKKLFV